MDDYATLLNQANRETFADYCMMKIGKEIEEQKNNFSLNVISWIEEQRKAFVKNIESNYKYIEIHLSDQQTLHNLTNRFSGRFAQIECQLLAAVELAEHADIQPILGEQIGKGDFYTVHMAQWDTENNLAVKKRIHPSTEANEMVALEAHYDRTVTRLCSDDHIAPLLHVYENNLSNHQRELWLFMPQYSISLQDYLKTHMHELTLSRAADFALTIAMTLAKLHHLEIVHRDIKSSNIMLDTNEQCYIIDFGTAKSAFYSRTILGTAPLPLEIVAAHIQQHTGFATYDGAAADIYSFGLLLYEMFPKPSYQRLDLTTLPNVKQSLLSPTTRGAHTEMIVDRIVACLDPVPAQRPCADDFATLRSIPKADEIKQCMSCEDRERTVRFVPCQHKVMCDECWQQWCAKTKRIHNVSFVRQSLQITQDNDNATFFSQSN